MNQMVFEKKYNLANIIKNDNRLGRKKMIFYALFLCGQFNQNSNPIPNQDSYNKIILKISVSFFC
jgi:hypothetical protein